MDCFIASLCFFNVLLFSGFVSSSGLLGQSPDLGRCQPSLHPASISLNWGHQLPGCSGAPRRQPQTRGRKPKSSPPEAGIPEMPYWSCRDERILGRRKGERRKEGPSQVLGTLGMSSCWSRWVLTKKRELPCCGKSLLTR